MYYIYYIGHVLYMLELYIKKLEDIKNSPKFTNAWRGDPNE